MIPREAKKSCRVRSNQMMSVKGSYRLIHHRPNLIVKGRATDYHIEFQLNPSFFCLGDFKLLTKGVCYTEEDGESCSVN